MADYFVHESSYVDEGAVIGAGSKVWHFSHVMPGAVIGENCNLGQNVVVMPRTRIGNNVKVQNNVSIYEGVTLEDDVFCGPSCVFTNVMNPRSHVSRKAEYRNTLVRRGATIGANATIVCGVTLGEYAFIGAGAVITNDVPAYSPHGRGARPGASAGCASAGSGSRWRVDAPCVVRVARNTPKPMVFSPRLTTPAAPAKFKTCQNLAISSRSIASARSAPAQSLPTRARCADERTPSRPGRPVQLDSR